MAGLLLLLIACQPATMQFAPPQPRTTLGEAVFQILRDNLQAGSTCTEERLRELEENRALFVATFDRLISEETTDGLGESLESTLLPLIDDGSLPALTETLGDLMRLLVEQSPTSDTLALEAILRLAQTRTVMQGRDVTALVEGLLADAQLKESIHGVAQVALADDNGTTFATALLEMVGPRIKQIANPSSCQGMSIDSIDETLLRSDLDPSLDFGVPAWALRADDTGNPRVAIDPVTGSVYAPFVDGDSDGIADTDIDGNPIDASGVAIEIPPFDTPIDSTRDAYGRAIADDGELLYVYFDAKRTGLSVLLQFAGEAVDDDLHHDLTVILEAILGAQVPCPPPDDVAGCLTYPANDNPVADLAFALLEDLRYERIATLLETWEVVMRDDPDTAEAVFVSVGQILAALEQGGLRLTDGELVDLVILAMPMLADVFESNNSSGSSTARLLLDVIHQLGNTARDLPAELQVTMEYATLHKDSACSGSAPDLSRSRAVDFSQPRYFNPGSGWVDNRSAIEQEIELLTDVDCGSVPFTGKSVAEVVLEVMADASPTTACNIIDLTLGVMNLPLIGVVGEWLFEVTTGCPGGSLDDLEAMDALAKSGALDAMLPIANAFEDRGQIKTLLAIFGLLAHDLRKDESPDPDRSTIRRALPTLITVLQSGAADSLFDLDDLLTTVQAVDGSGDLADVVVDSFEFLTDDTGTVQTRAGPATGTSVGIQMLTPYREIVTRLETAGATDDMEHVIEHVAAYLKAQTLDGGDPLDPNDDRYRLTDRRLMSVYEQLLGFASETFDLTPTQRTCYFDEMQSGVDDFLTSPDLATSVRLLRLYSDSPHKDTLDGIVTRWLTVNPAATPGEDAFGSLARVLAAGVQIPTEDVQFSALLDYLGRAVEEIDAPLMITTIDQVLTQDPNDTILVIVRKAIDHGPDGIDPAALETFLEIFLDVISYNKDNLCAPVSLHWTIDEAEEAVRAVVDFIDDDELGLGAVYELIVLRTPAE